MRKFRILALMLVLIMVLAGCGTGNSTPAAKDIVILYTNDAHCGIEDGMGYQGLSAAKRALLAAGNKVLLVDNGDAVQGDLAGGEFFHGWFLWKKGKGGEGASAGSALP